MTLMPPAPSAGAFCGASIALGANNRIQYGVIGVGAWMTYHLKDFVRHVEAYNNPVAAASDVYQKRLTSSVGICQGNGHIGIASCTI
jgi:hypothetical protein